MGSIHQQQPTYQDDTRYQLPTGNDEFERLDAQSASLVALMKNQPFHAPLETPKRLLDIGCGTGSMTHLLATTFPDAQVIGVDLAPVPLSRHGQLANVQYVQGDVRDLIGKHPDFEEDSFDYIFQRLLMFGLKDWPGYVSSVSRLLKPSGWLEVQEPSMQVFSQEGAPLADSMLWYQKFRPDAESLGLDIEIGPKLDGIFQSTPSLHNVKTSMYTFSPIPSAKHKELHGLQSQLPKLWDTIISKISGSKRDDQDFQELYADMRQMWDRGFEDGAHYCLYAVTGQKRVSN